MGSENFLSLFLWAVQISVRRRRSRHVSHDALLFSSFFSFILCTLNEASAILSGHPPISYPRRDDKPGDHITLSKCEFRRCSVHPPFIHPLPRQFDWIFPCIHVCFLIAYFSVFFLPFNSQKSASRKYFSHVTKTTPKTAFISRTWHSICQMQAKRYC